MKYQHKTRINSTMKVRVNYLNLQPCVRDLFSPLHSAGSWIRLSDGSRDRALVSAGRFPMDWELKSLNLKRTELKSLEAKTPQNWSHWGNWETLRDWQQQRGSEVMGASNGGSPRVAAASSSHWRGPTGSGGKQESGPTSGSAAEEIS